MAKVELEAETLLADPGRLLDEVNAMNMFGGQRVVLVRQAGRLTKSFWHPVLEGPQPEAFVIFLGDDLAKTAPLRSAAESGANILAIACYSPEPADRLRDFEQKGRSLQIRIESDARALLLERLGADQGVSEQELEKLLLYCSGQESISVRDVEDVLTDTSAGNGAHVIDLAFGGEMHRVETEAARAFRNGVSPASLISIALQHCQMLVRLKSAKVEGQLEPAIKQERLFFRRVDGVKCQAEYWSERQLTRALEVLASAQRAGRQSHQLEEIIAIRALWSVALAGRRR
jgi:DNA polymerase-3 subunit delta